MKTLVFASNNAHKLEEVRSILGAQFEIKSLREIGCFDDIPETADTFRGNALQKAQYIQEHYGYDCFADDSGLEVKTLNNEPGVFSARYAAINNYTQGNGKDDTNMNCLLAKLQGNTPAPACFRTSIAIILDGETHFFDGIVEGKIISDKRGAEGFGYDPIFVPDGYEQTFAELGSDVKNGISHRARAVANLVEFLKGETK